MSKLDRELTDIELRLIEQYHKRLEEKDNKYRIRTYGSMDCPDCAYTLAPSSWSCPVCGWEDLSRKPTDMPKYEVFTPFTEYKSGMMVPFGSEIPECCCDRTCMMVVQNGKLTKKCPPHSDSIPREKALPVIEQMCLDTEAGDLRWFPLTPGIGVCYGVTECDKKSVYTRTEFGNYTGTIYDLQGEGKFNLYHNDLHGWVDKDLGEKLLNIIKESMKG